MRPRSGGDDSGMIEVSGNTQLALGCGIAEARQRGIVGDVHEVMSCKVLASCRKALATFGNIWHLDLHSRLSANELELALTIAATTPPVRASG